MKSTDKEWLSPPIEQTTREQTTDVMLVQMKLPHTKTLIKRAVKRHVFEEASSRESEAVWGEGPGGNDDDEPAISTTKEVVVEDAVYRYTYPTIFETLRNEGAPSSLLTWIYETFTAHEFDAMYRLHGREGFTKYMSELFADRPRNKSGVEAKWI